MGIDRDVAEELEHCHSGLNEFVDVGRTNLLILICLSDFIVVEFCEFACDILPISKSSFIGLSILHLQNSVSMSCKSDLRVLGGMSIFPIFFSIFRPYNTQEMNKRC